jgi:hypothetical protein
VLRNGTLSTLSTILEGIIKQIILLGKSFGVFERRRVVGMWVGLNYFPKASFCICDVNERRGLFLAGFSVYHRIRIR